jgi:hypothetical protein
VCLETNTPYIIGRREQIGVWNIVKKCDRRAAEDRLLVIGCCWRLNNNLVLRHVSGRSIRWTGTLQAKGNAKCIIISRALQINEDLLRCSGRNACRPPNLMHPERQVSRALRCTSELHLWLVTAQLLSLARCNPIVLFNFVFLISKKKKKRSVRPVYYST